MANAAHSVSEQFHKLIYTETGLPDDSPQCATIEFLMVRYGQPGQRVHRGAGSSGYL